jgi:hypothetical protein
VGASRTCSTFQCPCKLKGYLGALNAADRHRLTPRCRAIFRRTDVNVLTAHKVDVDVVVDVDVDALLVVDVDVVVVDDVLAVVHVVEVVV